MSCVINSPPAPDTRSTVHLANASKRSCTAIILPEHSGLVVIGGQSNINKCEHEILRHSHVLNSKATSLVLTFEPNSLQTVAFMMYGRGDE
jgi:hypothetical protein